MSLSGLDRRDETIRNHFEIALKKKQIFAIVQTDRKTFWKCRAHCAIFSVILYRETPKDYIKDTIKISLNIKTSKMFIINGIFIVVLTHLGCVPRVHSEGGDSIIEILLRSEPQYGKIFCFLMPNDFFLLAETFVTLADPKLYGHLIFPPQIMCELCLIQLKCCRSVT